MQDSFHYNEFHLSEDARTISFIYTIVRGGERHLMTETLTFPVPLRSGAEQLRSLRSLHLALGISYYKTFLADTIVHPYAMDTAEADFWNEVWQNGLGEFLYVNRLSVERLATFSAQEGQRFEGLYDTPAEGALLGIGGGKDSIVASELLRDIGVKIEGFVMATGEQLGQTASVAGIMDVPLHAIKRQIDVKLLKLQKQPHAYSGHVPISLIFGLVGTVLAIALDKKYVVVANEASASIPRIEWEGSLINHQWSKSLQLETALQTQICSNITTNTTYFSAIRQLSSIAVAKLFATLPQYFEVFTSDNFVFRMDPTRRPNGRWGIESPKSLSSYILLSPWLNDSEVRRIFMMDLFDEASLSTLFLELTGLEGEPPLDCVGTVKELVLSMNLLNGAGRYSDTVLMQLALAREVVHEADWQAELKNHLQLQPDHALPEELTSKITQYFEGHLS